MSLCVICFILFQLIDYFINHYTGVPGMYSPARQKVVLEPESAVGILKDEYKFNFTIQTTDENDGKVNKYKGTMYAKTNVNTREVAREQLRFIYPPEGPEKKLTLNTPATSKKQVRKALAKKFLEYMLENDFINAKFHQSYTLKEVQVDDLEVELVDA